MSELDAIDVEPPDTPCERCGHPKPRLVFDELRRLLLCDRCLDHVKSQQAWSLLREAEAV